MFNSNVPLSCGSHDSARASLRLVLDLTHTRLVVALVKTVELLAQPMPHRD